MLKSIPWSRIRLGKNSGKGRRATFPLFGVAGIRSCRHRMLAPPKRRQQANVRGKMPIGIPPEPSVL